MPDHLIDSNILIRLSNSNDPQYSVAENALDRLKQQGHNLVLVPQCCYEYWSVATRPESSRGGLGLTPAEAEAELARFLTLLTLRQDRSTLFEEWRQMVNHYGVSGVNAHDARLVAAMKTQGITHLLTFNGNHFARYSEIIVIDPAQV